MPISVNFPGNLGQVQTINALRGIPSYAIDAETLYVVIEAGRTYSFDPGSMALDDNLTVIRPDDRTALQAGRFLYVVDGIAPGPAGPPGPAGNVAASTDALSAAPVTNLAMLYQGVPFFWTEGDFTAAAIKQPSVYIASNAVPISQGAWVRLNIKALNSRTGLQLSGKNGDGVRPEGQLQLSNDPADPGHAIATFYNQIAYEESAIEFVGNLSNGAPQQQGAFFVRWYQDNNDVTTKQTVWAFHGVGGSQDNTPQEWWPGFNTTRVCVGDTAKISWQDAPKHEDGTEARNVFDVFTIARVGSWLNVGPDILYRTSLTGEVRASIQGGIEAGQVATTGANKGKIVKAGQIGYSVTGSTAYVQGWDPVASAFTKLAIYGSEITVGLASQKVGFFGVTPINRPQVTGAKSGNAALDSLILQLQALGLITDATTA